MARTSALLVIGFYRSANAQGYLVSYLLGDLLRQPSQPQRIVSELKETFVKRCIVERTNKAEIRPEEQSEKAESCRENLWHEIQLERP